MRYHRSTENIESQLEKSQVLVAQLNENIRGFRDKLDSANRRLEKCETKAVHFDVMMKAVNENVIVKAAWEKFMMTLRMTGYDGKE